MPRGPGAGQVAEPGSRLIPPVPSAQEAAWSDQQQTAHLPGKIPAQAETAVQGPARAQDQVLCHVAQDPGALASGSAGLRLPPLQMPRTPATNGPARPTRPLLSPVTVPLRLCPHARAGVCVCARTTVWPILPFVYMPASVSSSVPRVSLSAPSAPSVPLRLNSP